jgi:hypothetical protein
MGGFKLSDTIVIWPVPEELRFCANTRVRDFAPDLMALSNISCRAAPTHLNSIPNLAPECLTRVQFGHRGASVLWRGAGSEHMLKEVAGESKRRKMSKIGQRTLKRSVKWPSGA